MWVNVQFWPTGGVYYEYQDIIEVPNDLWEVFSETDSEASAYAIESYIRGRIDQEINIYQQLYQCTGIDLYWEEAEDFSFAELTDKARLLKNLNELRLKRIRSYMAK